ncbi:MAG: DUF1223 domain-containing protein [Acidobacteria bacterium]|nr:DUF1223 domain-containing protein [Acidobacteriota bacterium]
MRIAIAVVLSLIVVFLVGVKFFRTSINWSSASSVARAEADIADVTPNPNDGKRAPVIVELFTSEGCSSCPPADKVLAELESAQPVAGAEIIAMSEHVDYWNYIGWSDPFSSEAFSARQQAYAPVFRNDGVYTPQMVVDGQAEFVGSNTDKAKTAIARAAKLPKGLVSIQPERGAQTLKLKINVAKLPAVSGSDFADVLLAITETNLSSQVVRGENSGRRLVHTAVVREMRSLGRMDNPNGAFETTTTAMLKRDWKLSDVRVVVFVQEHTNKRILAAGSTGLSAKQM